MSNCVFPKCKNESNHQHHITYAPPVIKGLCRKHHEDITIINGAQARKIKRSLSNKFRWWVWFQWIEGKLKPKRTAKALIWLKDWGKIDGLELSPKDLAKIRKYEEKRDQKALYDSNYGGCRNRY